MEDTDHGDLSLRCHQDVKRKLQYAVLLRCLHADAPGPAVADDHHEMP